MSNRKDIVYLLQRTGSRGKSWQCRVQWSSAVGSGSRPDLAMRDWTNQHNKLLPKGNRKIATR